MQFKKTLLFSFCIFTSALFSQSNITKKYENYFSKSREIPHLHLNKTTFFKGENIWFQAYVLKQNKSTLHKETANLYVSIFDESGTLKEQHLVQIKNGMGNGNIKIDSSFTKKAYYIRASTKYMQNFSEDQTFSQKIKVLKNIDQKVEKVAKEVFYDFQLLPEGGHLLANTFNGIGILIKDANNQGIQVSNGKISNKEGKTVGSFTTNQFGIGKVVLFLKEKDNYVFSTQISKEVTISKQTPGIHRKGIALHLTNDVIHHKFILKLLTNPKSLKDLQGKRFTIMLHNTKNHIKDDFVFDTKNTTYSFDLKKNDLFEGINLITVFNEENKPILERLLYNDAKATTFNNIETTVAKAEFDSLKVTIQNNTDKKIMLSSSFLPEETKAYQPKNSIISSFLLKPFVKGDIQNAAYYLSANNKERLKNLDLLLLTQGWSKYNWYNIFNKPPKDHFNFEKGIDIVMKFNEKTRRDRLLIITSDENNFGQFVPFNQNKTFLLKNTFFIKNSKFKFGNKRGKDIYSINPSLTFSESSLYEDITANHMKELDKTDAEYTTFPFLEDEYIMLDGIEIEAKLQKEIGFFNSQFYVDRFQYNNWPEGGSNAYTFYSDYGSNNPFGISFYTNNRNKNIGRGEGFATLGWNANFEKYGTQIKAYGTPTYWNDYIDIGGYGILFRVKQFQEIQLPVGFSEAKEYYSPKYPSLKDTSYLQYGAIWWEPNITIEPNAKVEFYIADKAQKSLSLFVEGINENGDLIEKRVVEVINKPQM